MRGGGEQMRYLLQTMAGRALYARRKSTVEPVIGILKSVMGFRRKVRPQTPNPRAASSCDKRTPCPSHTPLQISSSGSPVTTLSSSLLHLTRRSMKTGQIMCYRTGQIMYSEHSLIAPIDGHREIMFQSGCVNGDSPHPQEIKDDSE